MVARMVELRRRGPAAGPRNDSAAQKARARDRRRGPPTLMHRSRTNAPASDRLPFPATTHCPHRSSSSDSRAGSPGARRQCTHTRPHHQRRTIWARSTARGWTWKRRARPNWIFPRSFGCSRADADGLRPQRGGELGSARRCPNHSRLDRCSAGRAGVGVFVGTIGDAVVGFAIRSRSSCCATARASASYGPLREPDARWGWRR